MIKITNEDNMELMKRYPDNYFDLAIVDPPYGINVNISMGRRKGDKKSNYHKFAGEDKSAPDNSYFKELLRVSKNQIIWGANHFIETIPNANSKCWIIWDKKFSNDVSFASAELAWCSLDKVVKTYSVSSQDPKRIHPTQKPVSLYEFCLLNYTEEGDKILDTHLGSGSIAIACHNLGYDLTACELDKDYYNAAIKRLQNHQQQIRMF